MNIRFKRFHQEGTTQFNVGEVHHLPSAFAEQMVSDGIAVEVARAERATLPRSEAVASVIPPSRPAGRKLFGKAR